MSDPACCRPGAREPKSAFFCTWDWVRIISSINLLSAWGIPGIIGFARLGSAALAAGFLVLSRVA